jgi:hypothetical protein
MRATFIIGLSFLFRGQPPSVSGFLRLIAAVGAPDCRLDAFDRSRVWRVAQSRFYGRGPAGAVRNDWNAGGSTQ